MRHLNWATLPKIKKPVPDCCNNDIYDSTNVGKKVKQSGTSRYVKLLFVFDIKIIIAIQI
jgi:hypothetical protein